MNHDKDGVARERECLTSSQISGWSSWAEGSKNHESREGVERGGRDTYGVEGDGNHESCEGVEGA